MSDYGNKNVRLIALKRHCWAGMPNLHTIQSQVKKGEKITLVGFGTFSRKHRDARKGRNPQTGKELKIAAKNVPSFSAGKAFKSLLSK